MCVTKGENLHLCQRTVWSQWRGNVKNINVNNTLIRANMQTHKRPYFIFYPCTALQYFQLFINKACVHVCVWCQSSRQGGVDNLFGILTVMQKNTGMRMHTWLSAWLPDFLPQIHIYQSGNMWTRNFSTSPTSSWDESGGSDITLAAKALSSAFARVAKRTNAIAQADCTLHNHHTL